MKSALDHRKSAVNVNGGLSEKQIRGGWRRGCIASRSPAGLRLRGKRALLIAPEHAHAGGNGHNQRCPRHVGYQDHHRVAAATGDYPVVLRPFSTAQQTGIPPLRKMRLSHRILDAVVLDQTSRRAASSAAGSHPRLSSRLVPSAFMPPNFLTAGRNDAFSRPIPLPLRIGLQSASHSIPGRCEIQHLIRCHSSFRHHAPELRRPIRLYAKRPSQRATTGHLTISTCLTFNLPDSFHKGLCQDASRTTTDSLLDF